MLYRVDVSLLNTLNAQLNPICHLLALLGAHHILHVSGIRVKLFGVQTPTLFFTIAPPWALFQQKYIQ